MTQSTEQERAEIEALARRKAWRYKKSSDPHHSDTYTFNTHTLHDFADALLQAARRAQVVPQGWKLVPVEPTQEMYELVMREGYYHDDPKAVKAVLRAEYQDMLAAAPQPPEACTCPSGDGSLRWPCPQHPPEAEKHVAHGGAENNQKTGETRMNTGFQRGAEIQGENA